jgi:hypothetical protein
MNFVVLSLQNIVKFATENEEVSFRTVCTVRSDTCFYVELCDLDYIAFILHPQPHLSIAPTA